MTAPLDLYAGPDALARIRKEGLDPSLFQYFLGASGGPKWFILAGLDKVLFPKFFSQSSQPIDVIGSSAGAFRAACLTQNDPAAAIERLAQHYSHTRYSAKPTAAEISSKGRALLDEMMGPTGVEEVLQHPRFRAHLFVARCQHLMQFEPRPLQFAGLAMSALTNTLSRRGLSRIYERVIFSTPGRPLPMRDPYGLPTRHLDLTAANLKPALLASGAIPVVLEGVKDIPGAPAGMYRDGGIIDYHFDLEWGSAQDGLVMYPHFYDRPVPGWFDKGLRSRVPHHDSYARTLLMVPSAAFIASLPYQKIPDRKDFETLDADTRIAYWQTVIQRSNEMGEYFIDLWQSGRAAEAIKPLPFRCR